MPKTDLYKDPEILKQDTARSPEKKLVVGLDLATTTGVCCVFYTPGTPVRPKELDLKLGQLDLSVGNYETGPARFVRLRAYLAALLPAMIFFEDVKYSAPVGGLNKFTIGAILGRVYPTAEFFGALKGCVSGWAEEKGIPCLGISISAIKRRATGKGSANKEAVIAATNELLGTAFDIDGYQNTGVDNVCDAFFCCLVGLEDYAAGL